MTDMVHKKKEISRNSYNMARFKQTPLLTGKWNPTGGNFKAIFRPAYQIVT